MKTCPRCHEETMEDEQILNVLSRRGDIYICNLCGDEESLIDSGHMPPNERELEFQKQMQTDLP